VFFADMDSQVALALCDIAAVNTDGRVRGGDMCAQLGVCGETEHSFATHGFGGWLGREWSLDNRESCL